MKANRSALTALFLACALALAVVGSAPVHADNLYASIRGTVTDPLGAVVPDVTLSATNVATGIAYTTTTNKEGVFSFLELPVGDYAVEGEAQGFKRFESTGIHLDLNQVYALNVKLEVGTVSQELLVESNPVQVETTDMQLGTTVSGKQIVDLPLNGRNWTDLQELQPGVIGASDRFGMGGLGAYSGNGSESQQNSFLINGTDSNDSELNVALVVPSPDAIGEFRMITNTLNPEYGRNSGTIINATIKNGTNQFHGDLFEFYRDTFLDAKSWFELEASPFHQNEFGGTLGGPIVKDHAFFFLSYQGLRAAQPEQFTAPTVFSAAERTGDFSAVGLPKSSNPSPFPLVGTDGVTYPAGTAYSTIFPTGIIPTADLNPLSVKLMNQFVPLSNGPGNTYLFNPTITNSDDQLVYRLDEKLRERDTLWFYGLYETNPQTSTLPFTGTDLPGLPADEQAHTQEYTLAWNHALSPTALNEARLAYLRFNFDTVNPVTPMNPTSYGFTGITPQNPAVSSLPVMGISGFFTLGFSEDGPQPRVQNTYQLTDNFSKVWGRHNFKAGFNMDRMEINNPFYPNMNGNFSFAGGGAFSTGNPGADFLLGIPDSYEQASGSIVRGRGREYYSYVQDQWQVRSRLTLTYGLGWDIETPWQNLYANGEIMSAFRPGQQSTVFPNMPTGFVFPGDSGINKYGGQSIHYDTFAPRAGFAWSPGNSGNWSIRGGIGLYYNRTEEELALQSLDNPPFAVTSVGAGALGTTPGLINPFASVNPAPVLSSGVAIPSGTAINPYPYTPPAVGTRINPVLLAAMEPIGLSTTTEDPRLTAPRTTNYNLTIERQLSRSTILSIGYVGNVGRHEEGAYNLNYAGLAPGVNRVAADYIAPGAKAPTCTSDFLMTTALCPQTPLGGAQVPGGTPFNLPVYGFTGIEATEFNSNYNALEVELNRHFSNGLQVLAAYTWSRYFDLTSNFENTASNAPGLNPFDFRSMYAPSANDAPQRFVVSYTYTLPFYKLSHRWKRVTDNWNLLGIYTLQHGLPVAVYDFGGADSLTCDIIVTFFQCPDRANRTSAALAIGNPRTYTIDGSPNYWFNPAAFAVPAPGTGMGDAERNPLYGPGTNYTDMAVEKDVHIDDSKYFQLRFETFNTFNHANFAAPVTAGSPFPYAQEDVSNPTFGRIFGVQLLTTNGDGRVVQLGAKFYF